MAVLVFAVGSAEAPVCVTDILLLAALPFPFRPKELDFDSLEPPPMLSRDSVAVTPLIFVEVGDGWFRDDVLEGTFSRFRFSLSTRKLFFSLSVSIVLVVSDRSVDAVCWAVEVVC